MEKPTSTSDTAATITVKALSAAVSPQGNFENFIEHRARLKKEMTFPSYVKVEDPDPNPQPDDSELSIFDAQKYFNGSVVTIQKSTRRVIGAGFGLDRIPERDCLAAPRLSSASSSVDVYHYGGRNGCTVSSHATPTASSEASWNSQTGLLTNPPGALSVSIRNPPPTTEKRRGGRKWLFGNKCPCYGRSSILVEEKLSEPKTPKKTNGNLLAATLPPPWPERRIVAGPQHRAVVAPRPPAVDGANNFTFPVLTPQKKVILKAPMETLPTYKVSVHDAPRDSLEVFQPVEEKTAAAKPTPPPKFTLPTSPKMRAAVPEDDIASDASSDLFEIESFSTQTNSFPMYNTNLEEASAFAVRRLSSAAANGGNFYSRPSVDEPVTPSIAATECYEPSEVSIDWSVVTAEGFDKGSAVTNYSVNALTADYQELIRRREETEDGAKRRVGGLLSCHCEKAVSVGPQPVSSSSLRHVSVGKPPISSGYSTALGASNSARFSIPFAI